MGRPKKHLRHTQHAIESLAHTSEENSEVRVATEQVDVQSWTLNSVAPPARDEALQTSLDIPLLGSDELQFDLNFLSPELSMTGSASDVSAPYAGLTCMPQPLSNTTGLGSPHHCQCLSILSSQLSLFNSFPPVSFPYSLHIPEAATKEAWGTLHCQSCPKDFVSGVQNLMLLTTVLTLITNEYAKILDYVDEKADQGNTVPFRMGNNDPALANLHTGTLSCPMGLDIEIPAESFRTMAKGVVKGKVLGRADSNEQSLSNLLEELENRQKSWHNGSAQRGSLWKGRRCEKQVNGESGMCTCVQLVGNVRRALDGLPFD